MTVGEFIAAPVDVVRLNALEPANVAALDADTQRLVQRRRAVMGPAYHLVYREPLRPVRAQGTKIVDVHGDEYLDAYNNVASVGHNHPRVVEAVTRQLQLLNTNTRYLCDDIVEYAENLVATHGPRLTNVMFTCTGSESNDLAMRMARRPGNKAGGVEMQYRSFPKGGPQASALGMGCMRLPEKDGAVNRPAAISLIRRARSRRKLSSPMACTASRRRPSIR